MDNSLVLKSVGYLLVTEMRLASGIASGREGVAWRRSASAGSVHSYACGPAQEAPFRSLANCSRTLCSVLVATCVAALAPLASAEMVGLSIPGWHVNR